MAFKFNKTKSKELDNISVTGYRILTILNMLLNCPCNEKEINKKLNNEVGRYRPLSKDTILIYLNTLRLIGCEISRPTKNNNYKYKLNDHPFKLSLKNDEIICLIELRKFINESNDWKLAYELDNLYNELTNHLNSSYRKELEQFRQLNLARDIPIDHISHDLNLLERYCKKNKLITVVYDSPETGEKNIELAAEKISFENGAYYLWGYSNKHESSIYLRIDRIKSIKAVSIREFETSPNYTLVKFKLKGSSLYTLKKSEYDKIVEKTNKEIFIESRVKNKFKFLQRMLSYGNDCTILGPESIKNELTNLLEELSEVYNDIYVS